MNPNHPDYKELKRIADVIIKKSGGMKALEVKFPLIVREVIDSIIDPVRTGRTLFSETANVEKTFVGLRLEHAFRDMIDVPSGLRDLVIDGLDVDVKNTVGSSWTIPPETYRDEEPCVLLRSDENTLKCWLGVIFARAAYLTKGKNRDKKLTISAEGKRNILWILEGVSYPSGRWGGIDTERFRALRAIKGGKRRAYMFFNENVGLKVHRSVIQALLYDQDDYMKRTRKNSGARDLLEPEGVALLSGKYHAALAETFGYGLLDRDEFIAIRPVGKDQVDLLRARGFKV